MYTLQGLWTQAREGLNITTLLCSNRRYKILQNEVVNSGITDPGPMTRSLTDLSDPTIGWASIAQGLGVPSVTVERAEDLAVAMERGLSEPGPFFIEMLMAD
jgi:acetolactate synthase-1/2/3 large subunit